MHERFGSVMIRWLPSQTDIFKKKQTRCNEMAIRMASMPISIESVIPCNTLTQETIWIFLKQNLMLVVVSLSKPFCSLRLKLLDNLHNDAAELLAFFEILEAKSTIDQPTKGLGVDQPTTNACIHCPSKRSKSKPKRNNPPSTIYHHIVIE